jgi:hypothetical protein
MVSELCAFILTATALVAGALLGVLWSRRPGHGEHAFYDPAFSVSALTDRLAAESTNPKHSTKRVTSPRAHVVEVQVTNHGPDDPALFRYSSSAPGLPPPADAAEQTRPLPRPVRRLPADHQVQRLPPASTSSSPVGRHALPEELAESKEEAP